MNSLCQYSKNTVFGNTDKDEQQYSSENKDTQEYTLLIKISIIEGTESNEVEYLNIEKTINQHLGAQPSYICEAVRIQREKKRSCF